MASLQRTIKREMTFKGISKAQRTLWTAQHGGKKDTKYNGLREAARKYEGIRKHSEKQGDV